jgi:hypothetical protein
MASRDLRATSGAPDGAPSPSTPGPSDAEPFYVRQSGDVMTDEEARRWFQMVAQEARDEGATFGRYSFHVSIPNLRIVEAWKERPRDQGEIRWALSALGNAEPGEKTGRDPSSTPDVSDEVPGSTS